MTDKIEAMSRELTALYQSQECVSTSLVLDHARSPDSAMHDYFEWDDTVAGHQYRLGQCRKLVKRLHIYVEEREVQLIHVPVYQSPNTEGRYVAVTHIAEQPDAFQLALGEALGRVRGALRDVKKLSQVEGIGEPNATHAAKAISCLNDALKHVGQMGSAE